MKLSPVSVVWSRLLYYLQSVHFNRLQCLSSPMPVACSFQERIIELWKCLWKYMKNGSLGRSPWKEAIKPDCFHSPKESSKSELMEWNKWIIKESCIMIFYTRIKYQTLSKYCDFQLYTPNRLELWHYYSLPYHSSCWLHTN